MTTNRTRIILSLLVGCALAGGQQAGAQDKGTLQIGKVQKAKFVGRTELREFELSGTGIKELTIRFLMAVDGKSRTVQENVYRWEKPLTDAKLELLYLSHDGEPFGATNKRLHSFALRSKGMPVVPSTSKRETTLIEVFPVSVGRELYGKLAVAPDKQTVIQWEIFGGTMPGKAGTVDELVEASKGGRKCWMLVLEWKTEGGGK